LGSNIGNHSLFFATQCPCDELICVDASKDLCVILEYNFKLNNINTNYKIINCAITDLVTNVTLSVLNETTCHIINKGSGEIASETLDSLFGDIKNVAVLKMDIEEWEEYAIMGAKKFFTNNHPLVIAELLNEDHFNAFEKEIKKYGYETDGVNYACTPTYIWTNKEQI
jgi:FkbM family methyltransferase